MSVLWKTLSLREPPITKNIYPLPSDKQTTVSDTPVSCGFNLVDSPNNGDAVSKSFAQLHLKTVL